MSSLIQYNFQFLSINKIFKIRVDTSIPLKSFKNVLVDILLSKDDVMAEILRQLNYYLEKSPIDPNVTPSGEQQLLESLRKTLGSLFERAEEVDFDDSPKENELSSSEIEYLNKCFQLFVGGKAISLEDEEKTVNDLQIQKNQSFAILLNFKRGFEERPNLLQQSTFNISGSAKDETCFFTCEKHSEKTTHYCKTCQKMICCYDIIPLVDSKEENCKNHSVITLVDYQNQIETEARQSLQKIQKFQEDCEKENLILSKQSEMCLQKKKMNEEEIKKSQKLSQDINSILSIQNPAPNAASTAPTSRFSVFHNKLEKLIKIQKVFENTFDAKIVRRENNEDEKKEIIQNFEIIIKKTETEKNEAVQKLEAATSRYEKGLKEKEKEMKSKITQEISSNYQMYFRLATESAIVKDPFLFQTLVGYVEDAIGKTSPESWKLVFSSATKGYGAANFHQNCDRYSRSLVVMKAEGAIFGGFTNLDWTGKGFFEDDAAFIFTLSNPSHPERGCQMYISLLPEEAIYCDPNYGPCFGRHEIEIRSNCHKVKNTTHVGGNNYYIPGISFDSEESTTFLCPSKMFSVEIEVFYMDLLN